jgi:hypothetical protein
MHPQQIIRKIHCLGRINRNFKKTSKFCFIAMSQTEKNIKEARQGAIGVGIALTCYFCDPLFGG